MIQYIFLQMGTKIVEVKRLKKANESTKEELETLRHDLETSQMATHQAVTQLETANQLTASQQADAREGSTRTQALEAELGRVTREMEDNKARMPVLEETIQVRKYRKTSRLKTFCHLFIEKVELTLLCLILHYSVCVLL